MNVAQLKKLYDRMFRYMVDKNIPALSALHTEDFELVHITGIRQNKQAYLHAIQKGILNYYAYSDIEIIPQTPRTFIGRCKVLAAVYGGGKHTWRLQFDVEMSEDNKFKRIVASMY